MKNILNCGFTFEEISLILLCQNKERDKIIGELQEYIDAAAPSMKRLLVQTIQKVRIASAEDLECAINYPIDGENLTKNYRIQGKSLPSWRIIFRWIHSRSRFLSNW